MAKHKVYQNLYAGYKTFFVPIMPARTAKHEEKAFNGYSLVLYNGEWRCEMAQYYISSLNDREHFPVVSEVDIDINDYIKKAILESVVKSVFDKLMERK